jgi:phage terminase small subunit
MAGDPNAFKKYAHLRAAVAPAPTGNRPFGGMNPQRQAFVMEYLIDLSPKNAAIRAGYSPANAGQAGAALMKVPYIRDAIMRELALRSQRVGLNADRVLELLGKLALGDPRSVLNADGSLKAPSVLNDDDAMMIVGVKTRRIVELNPDTGKMQQAEIQEVKMVDKLGALSLAMRHLGMMNDKIQVDVGGPLADQLAAALARVEGGDVQLAIAGTEGLTEEDYAAIVADEEGTIEGEVAEEHEPMAEAISRLIG